MSGTDIEPPVGLLGLPPVYRPSVARLSRVPLLSAEYVFYLLFTMLEWHVKRLLHAIKHDYYAYKNIQ